MLAKFINWLTLFLSKSRAGEEGETFFFFLLKKHMDGAALPFLEDMV